MEGIKVNSKSYTQPPLDVDNCRRGDVLEYVKGQSKCTAVQLEGYFKEIKRINPLIPDEMVHRLLDCWDTNPEIIERIVKEDREHAGESKC